MPKGKPRERDLKKIYTLTHDPKHPTTKVATTEDGNRIVPDRRRWQNWVSGPVAKKGEVTGTAEELYVNRGVDARGAGSREQARRRKRNELGDKYKL